MNSNSGCKNRKIYLFVNRFLIERILIHLTIKFCVTLFHHNYSNMLIKLIILSIVILAVNVPFGYWRANVKKFSLQWILAVHIPVVIVIALRILVHVGFAWYTFLFLVAAFFFGQSIGAYIHKQHIRRCNKASSCLFMDMFNRECR